MTKSQGLILKWGWNLTQIEKDPKHAYFFATFNDKQAFKIMLMLLPKDVLPLYLSDCQVLDDELLTDIVTCVKKLRESGVRLKGDEEIHLNGCSSLTPQSVKILAESGCSKFDLSGCDSILEGLSFLPPNTRELKLNNIKKLKDDDLKALKHCSDLHTLSLEGNASLTDAGLEHPEPTH